MSRRPFKTMKSKLIFNMVVIVGVGVALSSLLSISNERSAFSSLTEKNAELLANSIEKMLVREMESGTNARMEEIMMSSLRNPEVLAVRVIGVDGTVLKSSSLGEERSHVRPEIMERARTGHTTHIDNEGGERVFTYVRYILSRNICVRCHGTKPVLGLINVELSTRESERQITDTTYNTLLANVLAMVCVGLGTWVVIRMTVDRRMASLVETMKKVEAGDLSFRADVKGEDEIAELGARFNVMVSELETAQIDLRRYHTEQMEKAERLATLGQLAAGIAHEIKNPLAGIAGAIKVISSELDADDPRKEIFDEVLVQIDRLEQTVRDLLSFARPPKPEFRRANINEILSDALSLLMPQMKEQRIQVINLFSRDIPDVRVDEKQIQQVFINLILNAIQAMPNGGTLELGTVLETRSAQKNLFVRADIKDTGHGVDGTTLGEIFVPFFTTKHKGTGLGLSIAKRIIDEHHGVIEVQSSPGKGSTFSVLIPVEEQSKG